LNFEFLNIFKQLKITSKPRKNEGKKKKKNKDLATIHGSIENNF